MTTVIIPCKALRDGKSRLAGLLDDRQRHALCRDLLIHTIEMAQALVPAAQIRIVTSDAEARDVAAKRGITVLDDRGDGLNAALTQARDACAATTLLVLPIDLPLASGDDLKAALEANADVVIAPDAANSGTNILCLRRAAARSLPFSFGPDSLQAHRRAAERLGLSMTLVRRPGLAADIDTPQDYVAWRDRHALAFATTSTVMPA